MSRLSTRLTHNLLTALEIMESYTLQEIADLLEMQFTGALRKGVLSRTGENAIVLLINIEIGRASCRERV